jgi:hypothetical protein
MLSMIQQFKFEIHDIIYHQLFNALIQKINQEAKRTIQCAIRG